MATRDRLGTALLAAVISGFAVYANGLAVQRFDDATIYTTAKNALAGVILLGACGVWARRTDRSVPPDPRRWRRLGIVAVVGGSLPFVLFFEGLRRASSTDAAFIHKTLVVWVAIGATMRLGERLTWAHGGAIALLVAGHVVLAGGVPLAFGAGEAMIAAATLCWAVEVVIVKRLLDDVAAPLAATARMAGGALVLVGWVALRGDLPQLLAFDRTQAAWLLLTGTTLAAFVATWYRALSLAPAIDVTAVLVVGAVVTGVLNVAFRGAPISAGSAGYVLVLAGAFAVAAVPTAAPRPRLRT